MAPVEDISCSQPSRLSYVSIASSFVSVCPAPGSIPVIVYSISLLTLTSSSSDCALPSVDSPQPAAIRDKDKHEDIPNFFQFDLIMLQKTSLFLFNCGVHLFRS